MHKRLIIFFCGFCCVSLFLFLRIGTLSIDEELQSTGIAQSTMTLSFHKTRGQIYDCKMNSLTDGSNNYVAACLPIPQNMALLLKSAAFQTSVPIGELMDGGKPFLARSTFPQTEIPFVNVFAVPNRYSSPQLAQHIIGYTDSAGKGVTGVEKAFNDRLTANTATSTVSYKVDATRAPLAGIPPSVSHAPILTEGVVLTIDSRIQEICEEVGGRLLKKGAIVVMEPDTGKLRGVASFPSYDWNRLSDAVADSESSPLINRAFSAYNVGSTFKIVTAAAALSQGISPDTRFSCTGELDVLGQKFGCHEKNGHGELTLKQAMEVSCNPYFIQLGLQIDKKRFYNMAKDLSFSQASVFAQGLSTQKGYLPTLEELYNPADIGNFSFGQGLLMATPVQIARMVSAVVSEGNTPQAQLIEGYTQSGKLAEEKLEALPPVKAFSPQIANLLKNDLISSVMDTPNQRAKPLYVTAGGKTGTAQTGQIKEDGEELLQGWFAGFFPTDKPKYVVVVLSEDAKSGNQDASPIFCEIADRLNAPIKIKE